MCAVIPAQAGLQFFYSAGALPMSFRMGRFCDITIQPPTCKNVSDYCSEYSRLEYSLQAGNPLFSLFFRLKPVLPTPQFRLAKIDLILFFRPENGVAFFIVPQRRFAFAVFTHYSSVVGEIIAYTI